MKWLLKFLGVILGVILAIVGGIHLIPDIQGAPQQLKGLLEFVVDNLEAILFVICAILVVRLIYLDTQRAINDEDWPPIRKKLQHGLRALFKKDARIAEIKKVIEDDDVILVRDKYLAAFALNSIDWTPIEDLPVFGEEVRLSDGMDHIHISARKRMVCEPIESKRDEIHERFQAIEIMLIESCNAPHKSRFIKLLATNNEKAPAPSDAVFPDEQTKDEWEQTQARLRRANVVLRQLRQCLHSKASENCDIIPSESWSSQLFSDIEERIRQRQ